MPGRRRSRKERLPYSESLSPEQRKRWARRWLRLSWTRPRCIAARIVTFAAVVAAYFYFQVGERLHMDPSGWFWRLWLFAIAYGVSEGVADTLSRREVATEIAEERSTQGPNHALESTATR